MSVRAIIETRRVLELRISVCLATAALKIHPISLKFDTNVHVLSEISCIVFGMHSESVLHLGAHKKLPTRYTLWT